MQGSLVFFFVCRLYFPSVFFTCQSFPFLPFLPLLYSLLLKPSLFFPFFYFRFLIFKPFLYFLFVLLSLLLSSFPFFFFSFSSFYFCFFTLVSLLLKPGNPLLLFSFVSFNLLAFPFLSLSFLSLYFFVSQPPFYREGGGANWYLPPIVPTLLDPPPLTCPGGLGWKWKCTSRNLFW